MVAKVGAKMGGLVAALGDKGKKAVDSHKGDETKLGGGGELPAGVEGVAQLIDCKFSQHEKGEHKGKWFFYAAGTVLSPTTVQVEPNKDGVLAVSGSGSNMGLDGRRTSITEPMYDTPSRSRQTVDDHMAHVLNHFRLLGVDTSNVSVEQMESIAEALKKAKPAFNFRTWVGKSATEGKYKGEKPQVQHDWRGVCDFDPNTIDNGTVDNSGSGEGNNESANEGEEVDLDELAKLADQGGDAADEDAQTQLTEIATEAGVPEAKIAKAKNWVAVVKMIRDAQPEETGSPSEGEEVSLEDLGAKADEGEDDAIASLTEKAEEAGIDTNAYESWSLLATALAEGNNEPVIPTIGDVKKYKPLDKDKKPAKKAVKVEVVAVFPNSGKVNLKNLEDNKTSYKAVSFDALED